MHAETETQKKRRIVFCGRREIGAVYTVSQDLIARGCEVQFEEELENVKKAVLSKRVDLIFIGRLRHHLEEVELMRLLHWRPYIHVIWVCPKDCFVERVIGLRLGADDVISEGCEPEEIVSRMLAALRKQNLLRLMYAECKKQYLLDGKRKSLSSEAGDSVVLSKRECDLLLELVKHEGDVVTREHLSLSVLSKEWVPYERAIDNIVVKLRKLFKSFDPLDVEVIKTARYQGYYVSSGVVTFVS